MPFGLAAELLLEPRLACHRSELGFRVVFEGVWGLGILSVLGLGSFSNVLVNLLHGGLIGMIPIPSFRIGQL